MSSLVVNLPVLIQSLEQCRLDGPIASDFVSWDIGKIGVLIFPPPDCSRLDYAKNRLVKILPSLLAIHFHVQLAMSRRIRLDELLPELVGRIFGNIDMRERCGYHDLGDHEMKRKLCIQQSQRSF